MLRTPLSRPPKPSTVCSLIETGSEGEVTGPYTQTSAPPSRPAPGMTHVPGSHRRGVQLGVWLGLGGLLVHILGFLGTPRSDRKTLESPSSEQMSPEPPEEGASQGEGWWVPACPPSSWSPCPCAGGCSARPSGVSRNVAGCVLWGHTRARGPKEGHLRAGDSASQQADEATTGPARWGLDCGRPLRGQGQRGLLSFGSTASSLFLSSGWPCLRWLSPALRGQVLLPAPWGSGWNAGPQAGRGSGQRSCQPPPVGSSPPPP